MLLGSGTKEEITKDGARWIFIIEKFDQFMYGFYPEAEHWRPNLVLILFVVCIFIFRMNISPRARLVLLLVYPIVSFILISGGIFWF